MAVSDIGLEFVNTVLSEASEQLGIYHRLVSPYSPQTNGFAERKHKTINMALRGLTDKTNWALRLPLVIAAINNTFVERSLYTPSQYALRASVNLLGSVMFNEIKENSVITTPNFLDIKTFFNTVAKTGRQFKRYKNKHITNQVYSSANWYGLEDKTSRNLVQFITVHIETLLGTKHDNPEEFRVSKGLYRNVKTYVPRAIKYSATGNYNLRERKIPINYAEASDSDDL